MRKRIICAAAAVVISAGSARAQIIGPGTPVIDVTAIAQLLKSVGIEGDQLTQLVQTVAEIEQVYQEAILIYGSVNGLVHADTWAPSLLSAESRNPLPFAAADHPGWAGGFNDPSSLPFGAQYVQQNTIGGDISVYDPRSFQGAEFRKAIYSLSTMQALATTNVQSIENRIIGLGSLFSQLASIGTIQQTNSLKARLEAEANYAHSQKIQSQNLNAAAQQQLAVLQYNQRQSEYQDEGHGVSVICGSLAGSSTPLFVPECTSGSTTAGAVAGGG